MTESNGGAYVVDCYGETVGRLVDVAVNAGTAYAVVKLEGLNLCKRVIFLALRELEDAAGVLRTSRLASEIRLAATIASN